MAKEVVRTAPDGARVSVAVPATAGTLKWYGTTRFSGSKFIRGFDFAPAGDHEVIPRKILRDARTEVFRRRGYDLITYQAGDRSDSCLVFAGPHNEASTWFGGPLPRTTVLNRIVSVLTFADSPDGARLTAKPAARVQQHGTMVVGSDARMTLMIRDARQARDQLPDWRGLSQGDAEVWRTRMDLHEDQADKLAGTPFEWRYTYANPTAVFDVAFRDETPPGITLDVTVDEAYVGNVLSGLRVSWAA